MFRVTDILYVEKKGGGGGGLGAGAAPLAGGLALC